MESSQIAYDEALQQKDEEKRFDERLRNLSLEDSGVFSRQKMGLIVTMMNEGIPQANLDLISKNQLLDAVLSSDPKELITAKDEILVRERVRNREVNESRKMQKAAREFEKAGNPMGGAPRD